MVKDNMNTPIGVFAFKFRDDMFNERVIDIIRIIVRIIKETPNTSIDRVRLNEIELRPFTSKSNIMSVRRKRGSHGSEDFRKDIKARFRKIWTRGEKKRFKTS